MRLTMKLLPFVFSRGWYRCVAVGTASGWIWKHRAPHREIKNEVVDFATDILDVWGRFSKHPDLKDYAALLDETRKQAIKEAENVANQYADHDFKCPFSESNP
jgi:hypothetical protein